MFAYDAFVSYSSADGPVVLELASRLRADGIRVWLDQWEIHPGDNVNKRIEQGLDQSRVLLLAVSASAIASDWVSEERHSVFAGRGNDRRRLVPVLLEDVELPSLLKTKSYIDWRTRSLEQYQLLLATCRREMSTGDSASCAEPVADGPAKYVDDLRFLQSLNDQELCEWVVIPLLDSMGYYDIRYSPAQPERGRHLLFVKDDPIAEDGIERLSAVVHSHLTAAPTPSDLLYSEGQAETAARAAPGTTAQFESTIAVSQRLFITASDSHPCSLPPSPIAGGMDADRNVSITGDRLLALINKHLPTLLRSLPNPESRYLYLLCQRLIEHPTLKRLGSSRSLSIVDIYTGGTLSPITKEHARFISFAVADTGAGEPSDGVATLREIIDQKGFCAVIADVGTGKTTLLQKIVLDIGAASTPRHSGELTPLLISLAHIDEPHLASYEAFCEALISQVKLAGMLEGFELSAGGRFALLLDGFDELRGAHEEVEGYIQKLCTVFAKIVVTSRPSRVPDLAEPFVYYRLLPFGDTDIYAFLSKWFGDNGDMRDVLYGKIVGTPSLQQFCRTPLILTLYSLLASDSSSQDRLPVRRNAIYEQITEMLLGKWDRLRNVKNRFDWDVKHRILEVVAHKIHVSRSRAFRDADLRLAAAEVVGERSEEAVCEEIAYRSSLMRNIDAFEREFVHLSFQEYLCAKYLSRCPSDMLAGRIEDDDWWRGVFIFFFGVSRSLDGYSLGKRRKKPRGTGLRLIEYLIEADFTSASRRNEILGLVSNDLLGGTGLSPTELAVCRRIGNDLIDILDVIISQDAFEGHLENYFIILRAIGTRRAIEHMWQQADVLGKLAPHILLTQVVEALHWVSDDTGADFTSRGLHTLSAMVGRWKSGEGLVMFARVMVAASTAMARWRPPHQMSANIRNMVANAWGRMSDEFISGACDPTILRRLSRKEMKEVMIGVASVKFRARVRQFVRLCLDILIEERRNDILVIKLGRAYDSVLDDLQQRRREVEARWRSDSDAVEGLRRIIDDSNIWSW